MSIAAGRLIDEVTLLGPAATVDGAGQAVTSTRPVYTVPAEVKPTVTQETTQDGQTITRVTYRIVIRWIDDECIDEGWEVDRDGRTLAISAVMEQGRREELVITAHEVRR